MTIHVDAYNHLCAVLDTIEKPIKNAQVAEATLADYEEKLVKQLAQDVEPNAIIDIKAIRKAMDSLGSPEVPISALYDELELDSDFTTTDKRKLYRDPSNKIIAGVASGLAAYLGISDPIWVRIAFVGLMMAGFASAPIYILLWVVMPIASTSIDRKSMHGQPIDVASTANRVAHHLDNMSKGIRRKFGTEAGI